MKIALRDNQRLENVWFDFGEIVVVLGIELKVDAMNYILWSKRQNVCALFPVGMFDVVDDHLSARWVCSFSLASGCMNIGPAVWNADGFWDRFNDGDQEAEAIFNAERRLLENE